MIDIERIKELALDGDLYAVQELITRLDSAESSNKQWEDSYHSQQEYFLERTTAMQAKLEAAEQDAARYCWLRANDPNKVMSVNTNERINKFFPNQLDESIDYHSAIKEMK